MPISRRVFLNTSVQTGLAITTAPLGFVKKAPATVRVLGTHVTLQEPIRRAAEKELGIRLEFSPGGSASVLHQASTRPESFDLYEQWSDSMQILWQAGAIQPIETKRLKYWDEINSLTKTGRVTDNAKIGRGDAPNKLLFVQKDHTISSRPTQQISFLPYVHNVDSFGYNAAVVPEGTAYQTESWAWLLDERWRGRVAIVNVPSIGLFDLILAVQAAGLATFHDIGNLSKREIDQLFRIVIGFRKRGQFRGIWNSVPQSVELMSSGESVIESMFSPAVFSLKSQGVNCVYASPKEGYRAWHGVMCLSSKTEGRTKDAAYEYMNWWLSGWPGAFIARQGYYISNPQRSRSHMSTDEWDYWYEGQAARNDLAGTDGEIVVRKGEVRDGGAYEMRFNNIAVWNTVMPNYEYTLPKWNEFLSADL